MGNKCSFPRVSQFFVQTALMIASRASHRAVDIVYFHFLHFLQKNGTCVKKLSEGATALLFHLPLYAFCCNNYEIK